MASAYFLNGQTSATSVTVNSGQPHVIGGLMDQKNNPVVQVRLAANKDIDVVGTGATNYIVVTTPGTSNSIGWNVTLASIAPDQDIQFLVLDNRLLARQGSTTAGFTIQPST